MSRRSRFEGLAGVLKPKEGAPAKKLPKSKDKENYRQTTVYVHRDVYDPLQAELARARLEYSQLVEDLLAAWLKKRAKL